MKRICLAVMLLAAVGLMAQWPAPSGLVAYSFFTDHIGLEWTPPPPIIISDTIKYDNGIGSREIDLDSGMCAVKFSPAEPCSILSVQFNLFLMLGSRAVNINMYGVNHVGLPDYSNVLLPTRYTPVTVGWNNVDVSDAGLVVYDELFVRISKGDALPQMYILMDSSITPGSPRSYQYHYMYGWRQLSGDLLVRLEVLYLESRTRATVYISPGKTVYEIPHEPGFSEIFSRSYHPSPEPRMRPTEATSMIRPDSYRIYRASTYHGIFSPLAIVPASETTYDDYAVTPGNTYYYTVRAEYDSGAFLSPPSDTAAGTAYNAVGTLIYDTLLYDDGIPPSAAVSYPGAVIANKFRVDTRCRLIAIDYHISNPGFGSPKIYLDDRGQPGDEILGYGDYLLNSTGWARINVAMERIILDGDFYLGIELDHSLGISLRQSMYGHGWDLPPGGSWTEVPDTNYYIRALVQHADSSAYYHLYSGWNAVSLPVIPHDGLSPHVAFPGAEYVYEWDSDLLNYIAPDILTPGKGYFVFVLNERSYSVTGIPIHMYTLMNAGPGWEFVGGLSKYGGADTTAISEIPETAIGRRIFYYYDRAGSTTSGSYRIRDRFFPGEAYWLLFDEEGLFQLRE